MGERYDYAILGAGAVGTVIGAHLAAAGHRVELVMRDAARIEAINAGGVAVETDAGCVTAQPLATDAARVQPAARVIVTTKTHQLDTAVCGVRGRIGAAGWVALQNGLGNGARLARLVDAPVAHGVTMLPATATGPGQAVSHGRHDTWLGGIGADGAALAGAVARDLTAAGLNTLAEDRIADRIWQKAAFNCAMNALAALTLGGPGHIGTSPGLRDEAHALADEAIAVGRAEGARIDAGAVHALIDFACAEHGRHKPSMLQDIEAGRATEIDALNGYVAEAGARLGVDVPRNRLVAALVRGREGSAAFWTG